MLVVEGEILDSFKTVDVFKTRVFVAKVRRILVGNTYMLGGG